MNFKKVPHHGFTLYIILFVTLLSTNLFSNDIDNLPSSNFKKIITIDGYNKKIIDADFQNITYQDLFYFFSIVSEEAGNYEASKEWFRKVAKEIDVYARKDFGNLKSRTWNTRKKKRFAEKLVGYIHKVILKKYVFISNKLSSIIQRGEFNCVSSSIIYAIFLKKFGLNATAVETADHVFIKVIFDDESIDVETTNSFGFDPGKKKNVLDEFGSLTGFAYVPQNDYRNRSDINFKKLLMLVYHNVAQVYEKKIRVLSLPI